MNEVLTTLLKVLQLAPRYLWAAGLLAAALLFGSPQFLEGLGLAEFAKNQRPWLGLTLISACALLAAAGGSWLWGWLGVRQRQKKGQLLVVQRLHALTEEEKQILRFYISQQTRTNDLKLGDGAVQGLVAAGILRQANPFGHLGLPCPYLISEEAWRRLHENPGLLHGRTNTYRTDGRSIHL